MTERPIPFSAEMVLAILAGRKRQTRRVMKVQPYPDSIVTVEHFHQTVIDRHGDMQPGPEIFGAHWDDGEYGCRSPYGAPGDLLWVRETWAGHASGVDYAADFAAVSRPQAGPWRSSIHMPRWASRITLQVESVRVERLQDITQKDAIAEGAPESHSDIDRISRHFGYQDFSRSWFAQTWEDINGPGAWEANPWVWAISFERVKP